MIKIYSKSHNSEVLVNQSRIQYIVPTPDGCIIHFDSGNVLPSPTSLDAIELKFKNIENITLQKSDYVVNSDQPKGKIYPDEFPDDFPRFKNGLVMTHSKKYIEYMKDKET